MNWKRSETERARRTFADNLNHLMEVKQITPAEICSAVSVSKTAVSFWRSAQAIPCIANLEALAAFLDVSIEDLLGGK